MQQKQKPFKIHFVCRGNTYRSRLAAAYMNTLIDSRFRITSSGISAHDAETQTAELYTIATAKAYKLSHGIIGSKTQTTNKLLAEADVIIFMSKDVYDDALKEYSFDVRKAKVWHVVDVDPAQKRRAIAGGTEQALLDIAASTFATIRKHCDELYTYLTHTAWVDVVDADNRPTNLRLPMAWVTDRGLWHRGVHVVARTSDGKFVVGKRVSNIVFAPGMLEISLGGGVDTGEHPLQAARRETHEELGIHISEKAFRPLFMSRKNTYHPHYDKRTRVHVYVYAVTLPLHSHRLRPQPGEVDELRLLTKRQVKHLLNTYRIENFGRLSPAHKFFRKAVAYSMLPM